MLPKTFWTVLLLALGADASLAGTPTLSLAPVRQGVFLCGAALKAENVARQVLRRVDEERLPQWGIPGAISFEGIPSALRSPLHGKPSRDFVGSWVGEKPQVVGFVPFLNPAVNVQGMNADRQTRVAQLLQALESPWVFGSHWDLDPRGGVRFRLPARNLLFATRTPSTPNPLRYEGPIHKVFVVWPCSTIHRGNLRTFAESAQAALNHLAKYLHVQVNSDIRVVFSKELSRDFALDAREPTNVINLNVLDVVEGKAPAVIDRLLVERRLLMGGHYAGANWHLYRHSRFYPLRQFAVGSGMTMPQVQRDRDLLRTLARQGDAHAAAFFVAENHYRQLIAKQYPHLESFQYSVAETEGIAPETLTRGLDVLQREMDPHWSFHFVRKEEIFN